MAAPEIAVHGLLLPVEVFCTNVLRYLSPQELRSARKVCRVWRECIDANLHKHLNLTEQFHLRLLNLLETKRPVWRKRSNYSLIEFQLQFVFSTIYPHIQLPELPKNPHEQIYIIRNALSAKPRLTMSLHRVIELAYQAIPLPDLKAAFIAAWLPLAEVSDLTQHWLDTMIMHFLNITPEENTIWLGIPVLRAIHRLDPDRTPVIFQSWLDNFITPDPLLEVGKRALGRFLRILRHDLPGEVQVTKLFGSRWPLRTNEPDIWSSRATDAVVRIVEKHLKSIPISSDVRLKNFRYKSLKKIMVSLKNDHQSPLKQRQLNRLTEEARFFIRVLTKDASITSSELKEKFEDAQFSKGIIYLASLLEKTEICRELGGKHPKLLEKLQEFYIEHENDLNEAAQLEPELPKGMRKTAEILLAFLELGQIENALYYLQFFLDKNCIIEPGVLKKKISNYLSRADNIYAWEGRFFEGRCLAILEIFESTQRKTGVLKHKFRPNKTKTHFERFLGAKGGEFAQLCSLRGTLEVLECLVHNRSRSMEDNIRLLDFIRHLLELYPRGSIELKHVRAYCLQTSR